MTLRMAKDEKVVKAPQKPMPSRAQAASPSDSAAKQRGPGEERVRGGRVDAETRQGAEDPAGSDQGEVDCAQSARAHPTWLVDP